MQDVPHSACLCSYLENVRLLLAALNKHDKTRPTEFRNFIAKLLCNQESEECMFGTCCDCPSITVLTPEIDYNDISWWQRANDQNGKTEKQEFKGSLMDCFDILKQQSSYFLKHTYIKHMQSRAFISERESLKDDDSTVVIQVDFAENYTTQIQNAQFNHPTGYQSSLLYLLCVLGKKMVATQLLLLQTTCLTTNMQC